MIYSFIYTLLDGMFFAAITSLGFALLFNVPKMALKYCAIGGALGYGIRYICMQLSLSIEVSTFISATAIAFTSLHWSHNLLAPLKVFTVAAMLPLFPGIYAFKAMIAFIELNHLYTADLWGTVVTNFVKTLFIIIAITTGLSMPILLFYRRKPIV